MLLSYRKFIIGAVALICFGYGVVIISGYTLAQLWHQIVEGWVGAEGIVEYPLNKVIY